MRWRDHAAISVILVNRLSDCKGDKGACRADSSQCPRSPVLAEKGGGYLALSSHRTSLPALPDVPQPGLVPHTPAAVQSHQRVVKTSPGSLAELIHRAWLP